MEMKLIKLKKNRKILLQAFKEKKRLELHEQQNISIKKTNDVANTKRNKVKSHVVSNTITIAVASLDQNCGCTYITHGLANYIKKYIDDSVCVVDIPGKNVIPPTNHIFIFHSVEISKLYEHFNFIVVDVGNLKKCKESELGEFRRATIKVMVSKYEEDYLEQIADKIREDKNNVMKWKFLFNYVPKNLINKVADLMEDYEFYCLPLFNKDNPDRITCNIFETVIFH